MYLEELTIKQYESIQRYLDDLMTKGEGEHFRRHLNNNRELVAAMEFEREIRDYLFEKGEREMLVGIGINPMIDVEDIYKVKGMVEKIGQNWKQKKNKTFYLRPFISYAMAASFLGVIVMSLWRTQEDSSKLRGKIKLNTGLPLITFDSHNNSIRRAQKRKGPNTYFTAFFSMDRVPSRQPEMLAEVLADYKKGKYDKLINLDISNLREPEKTRDVSENDFQDSINDIGNVKQLGFYYKGLALLNNYRLPEAKFNFLWVVKHAKTDSLKIKSEWYLALIYMESDSPLLEIAPLLTNINRTKLVPYSIQAKDVLEKLGK